MRTWTTRLLTCLALTIVAVIAVVTGPAIGFGAAYAAEPPLRIGVSLGLSGSYENIARFQQRGYLLWEKHVNARGGILGRRVELVIRDDQSSPDVAKKIYGDYIEKERLDFIIGPYSSPITLAVAPIADRHGYPMLTAGASSDEIWRQRQTNVFGIYASARRYTIGFLAMLAKGGIGPVAIVGVNDSFSLSVAEGARRWAPDYGLRVTLYQIEPKDKPDLLNAARLARDSGAQALVLAGHFNESVQMRRALQQLGWAPAAYYATVGPVLPQFLDTLGQAANGTFSTSQWEAREAAYAAAQLLEQAIGKAGSTERAAVRQALYGLDTITLIGRFAVDRTGAQIKALPLIVQWQQNKREIVWPEELRTAAPVFAR